MDKLVITKTTIDGKDALFVQTPDYFDIESANAIRDTFKKNTEGLVFVTNLDVEIRDLTIQKVYILRFQTEDQDIIENVFREKHHAIEYAKLSYKNPIVQTGFDGEVFIRDGENLNEDRFIVTTEQVMGEKQ